MRGWQRGNAGAVPMETLVEDGHERGKTRDHFLGTVGSGAEGAGNPPGSVGVNLCDEAHMF